MTEELSILNWICQGQDETMGLITLVYMAFLVCLFLIFSSWYLIPVFLRWMQLRGSVQFVSKNTKNVSDLSEARRQIQSKILEKTRWAKDHYHNFRVTWEDARLPGENKAACPIRLKEFLTPEVVIEGIVNQRIAEALPGIFVALGIFGTFLGLVLGLMGLNIGSTAQLKQSLGQLISGLSLAFYTSLLGILLSVLFSMSYRWLLRRLERALLQLDELVSQLFPYHSNEHYVRKHFELQGDIKQSMQTLATDVATKITGALAPAMDEALGEHLVPILADLKDEIKKSVEDSKRQQHVVLEGFSKQVGKMSSTIADHFENSQQKQSKAMEEVLNSYVEHMNKAFAGQFQDMGRIIEETTKAQFEIKEQMVHFTDKLQDQFKVQSELIEKTSGAARILSESLESLEGISRELKSSADDIASAAGLLEESASKAMEGQEVLRESMDRQIQTMTTTREQLEKGWEIITDNTDGVVELIRQVIGELAEGVGNQLNNALNTFDSKVAEVVERFSGTLFETNQTIGELPGILAKLEETLEEMRSDISTQKNILDELTNTTRDMVAPNIEKAAEASRDLHQSAENISGSSKELKEWGGEIIDKLESNGIVFEEKTTASLNELRKWSEEFFKKIGHNLSLLGQKGPLYSSMAKLNDNMIKMLQRPERKDEGMSQAITTLNKGVSVLRQHIERLGDGDGRVSEELLENVKNILSQADRVSEGIRSDVMKELRNITESTNKMAGAFTEFNESLASVEAKKGFFRRIIKK